MLLFLSSSRAFSSNWALFFVIFVVVCLFASFSAFTGKLLLASCAYFKLSLFFEKLKLLSLEMILRSVEHLKLFDSIPWSLLKQNEYPFRTDSDWECKIIHSPWKIWPKYWILWSLIADKIISFLEKVCFCTIVLNKKLQ